MLRVFSWSIPRYVIFATIIFLGPYASASSPVTVDVLYKAPVFDNWSSGERETAELESAKKLALELNKRFHGWLFQTESPSKNELHLKISSSPQNTLVFELEGKSEFMRFFPVVREWPRKHTVTQNVQKTIDTVDFELRSWFLSDSDTYDEVSGWLDSIEAYFRRALGPTTTVAFDFRQDQTLSADLYYAPSMVFREWLSPPIPDEPIERVNRSIPFTVGVHVLGAGSNYEARITRLTVDSNLSLARSTGNVTLCFEVSSDVVGTDVTFTCPGIGDCKIQESVPDEWAATCESSQSGNWFEIFQRANAQPVGDDSDATIWVSPSLTTMVRRRLEGEVAAADLLTSKSVRLTSAKSRLRAFVTKFG